MRGTIVGAWALFFGLALIMVGNGLQGTLLGLRAAIEGFPTAVTGLVMSGYFIGFLAGSWVAPRLLGRVGHIRVFAALASLASVSVLLHSILLDPATWMVMRIVTGFSYAGLFVVVETWLNDRATNETRGQLLSIYMIVMLAGSAAGQFLLNAADPGGYELFILVSVLVSLALVPILLTAVQAPDVAAQRHIGPRALYRISPLGIVGGMCAGMGQSAFFGMGAVYGEGTDLSIPQISVFMSAGIIGGIAFQWPVGRASDRFDRRAVITVVAVVASAAAALALPAAAVSQAGLIALTFLFGGMAMPLYSLCMAHTNDYLEPDQMVAAGASYVLVVGIGACFGPVTASVLMAGFGPAGLFVYLALVHGAVAVFAVYRMSRRAATPLEDQGEYVAMPPRASPIAVALAPQGDEDAGGATAAPAD